MNKKQKEKLADKIIISISKRLEEFGERCEKSNCNDAYLSAFVIGLKADIVEVLK